MTSDQLATLAREYAFLMEELKLRQAAIVNFMHTYNAGLVHVHPRIAEEFCFLQLRLICELLSIGCLVLHGDIKETEPMKKAYQADFLMNRLRKLNADYYPRPFTLTQDTQGHKSAHPITSDYLMKGEFLKLYREECGTRLHRGRLYDLERKPKADPPDFPKVADYANKFIVLLGHHHISMPDPHYEVWITMQNEDGHVAYNVVERVTIHPRRPRPVSPR